MVPYWQAEPTSVAAVSSGGILSPIQIPQASTLMLVKITAKDWPISASPTELRTLLHYGGLSVTFRHKTVSFIYTLSATLFRAPQKTAT